jgi:hypothetical protein
MDTTDPEWLAEFFEFELCTSCGRDGDQHTVGRDGFGNRRPICLDPIPDTLDDAAAEQELARRTAS